MTRSGPARVVVLDNEALQAVAMPTHHKHQRVLEVLHAGGHRHATRVVVATAVRVEAGVATRSLHTAGLGRFKIEDVPLNSSRADRAIVLGAGLAASAVDATVAQCAEEFAAAGARVTVFTSDVRDLERLCSSSTARIAVRRV